MQIQSLNNTSFKATINTSTATSLNRVTRVNAWEKIVKDSRNNGTFEELDEALTGVYNSNDLPGILALEEGYERVSGYSNYVLSLYKSDDYINLDRSNAFPETFHSVNQSGIKILTSKEGVDVILSPTEKVTYKSLTEAVINTLKKLVDISSKEFYRLTSDKHVSAKNYLQRFATKVVK